MSLIVDVLESNINEDIRHLNLYNLIMHVMLHFLLSFDIPIDKHGATSCSMLHYFSIYYLIFLLSFCSEYVILIHHINYFITCMFSFSFLIFFFLFHFGFIRLAVTWPYIYMDRKTRLMYII